MSSLPRLGTRQVVVWNINWHREANAEAVKEWQAAVDVVFYTAAPQMARECPEVKTSIARNQAGFTSEELKPMMVQRYW